MEYKAYMEQQKKDEKGRMKKKLLEWGGAIDLCSRKQEALRRVEKLQEEQRKIFGEDKTIAGMRLMAQLEKRYEQELAGIEGQIEQILWKKAEIDRMMTILSGEEQTFAILRYEKGYNFDYIGLKMHMSRATLFRLQDKLLQKMIVAEKEAEVRRQAEEVARERLA